MTNKLYIGDNLLTLQSLDDNSIDCIYTDPPYFTGNKKLTYSDTWKSEQEWIEFMKSRLIQCHRVMKKSATILIHIDSKMHIELATLCNSIFGKKNHIETFCWKKRSSGAMQSKFSQTQHEYILAYSKDIKKTKWNGIPQFDPKDKQIPQAHSSEGNSRNSGPNQAYSLHVEPEHSKENGDSTNAFKMTGSKQTRPDGQSSRPNQNYPVYVNEKYHQSDDVSPILITPHHLDVQGYSLHIDSLDGRYTNQDGYGDFHTAQLFDQHGAMREKGNDNNHYQLYTNQDGYGEWAAKQLKIFNANNETRDSDNKYPLHTNSQRISLTPFPGSIEIKPMNGTELGCWRCIPATCQKLIDANMLVVKYNKQGRPKIYQKQYAHFQFNKKTGKLEPFVRTTPISSIILEPTNTRSNKEIKEIFGKTAFTYSKPSFLVERLIKVISNTGDIVCDPFAGSGTTGEAAFRCGRQFILMQIDEGNIPELIKIRLNKKVGKTNYEVIT